MTAPVIMVIDDDQAVLNAVERDIRAKFGRDYRVVKANSGESALDVARQLLQRNEIVALFLSDQRMPKMTGIQFLEQARSIFPGQEGAADGLRRHRSRDHPSTACSWTTT
jgi:thioredoxin reductase (NADPH)